MIHRNIITPTEREELITWVHDTGWFPVPNFSSVVTYPPPLEPVFHSLMYEIQNRLVKLTGLKTILYNNTTTVFVTTHGIGINVMHESPLGYGEHIDLLTEDGQHIERCVLLVNKSDLGGELYIDGQDVDLNEGDAVQFVITKQPHGIKKVYGRKPRITFHFSWIAENV